MDKIQKQVNEILVAHNLDFTIIKRPLSAKDDKGNDLLSPYFGLYNSKTNSCINAVKVGYGVSQNEEIVEAALRGVANFGDKLKVYKAGSLNDGRKVYVQFEIEGVSKVGKDVIKRYVTLIDSNDGSTGLSVGIGDLTMSCQNQFFRFYKAGNAKFRHTATIAQKILSIPSLIEKALSESLQQIKVYNAFVSTPLTKQLANEMVKAVLGYDRTTKDIDGKPLTTRSLNLMDSLYEHIDHEIKDKGQNLWGLHSGVTRWVTHERKGPNRANGREESLIAGSGYKKNELSFAFAVDKAGLKITKEGLVLV